MGPKCRTHTPTLINGPRCRSCQTAAMPNKAHKSKFATKGEIRRKSQGRVEKLKVTQRHGPKLMASGNRAGHKVRQLQSLKDKRQNKRQEVLHERRIGTAHGPPKVVAFFGLSSVVDPHKMRDRAIGLAQQQRAALDPHTQAKYGPQAPELGQQAATCIYPEFSKARLTLLSATNDLDRQLDAAKVADVAVLVIRAAHDDTISQCSTLGRRASSIIELDDEDLDMAYALPRVPGRGRPVCVGRCGLTWGVRARSPGESRGRGFALRYPGSAVLLQTSGVKGFLGLWKTLAGDSFAGNVPDSPWGAAGSLNVLTATTRRRWRSRNGGVKTAAWRTFRRTSTLRRAVKNKRVTVQGPVKKPPMGHMSHRGSEFSECLFFFRERRLWQCH